MDISIEISFLNLRKGKSYINQHFHVTRRWDDPVFWTYVYCIISCKWVGPLFSWDFSHVEVGKKEQQPAAGIDSVHKPPSFLYPHSHPHCVRFLRVFLGAPAPKKIYVKINIVWFDRKKEGKKQKFKKFKKKI